MMLSLPTFLLLSDYYDYSYHSVKKSPQKGNPLIWLSIEIINIELMLLQKYLPMSTESYRQKLQGIHVKALIKCSFNVYFLLSNDIWTSLRYLEMYNLLTNFWSIWSQIQALGKKIENCMNKNHTQYILGEWNEMSFQSYTCVTHMLVG